MVQYDGPANRDPPVETGLPVWLLGREALRAGTVGQVNHVDAAGVLVAVAGQRGPRRMSRSPNRSMYDQCASARASISAWAPGLSWP